MVSILIDDDLLLRSYQADDVAELFRAVSASRAHLRHWLNWVDRTTRPEHSHQFIQQSLQQLQSQEGLALGIFSNMRIIGGIGMHHWDHQVKRAQLGYWLSAEHEGKGIVHTCLHRFIDFLFDKAGLNKLEIHYVQENMRSAQVASRLGFRQEGIIRQSCIMNGNLQDIVMTGLLKGEWENQYISFGSSPKKVP